MRVPILLVFIIFTASSWGQETKLPNSSSAFSDSTYSPEKEEKLRISYLDDPSKQNIVIDDFRTLVDKALKISLPISLSSAQVQFGDTTREYFLTRTFFEKYLVEKPLLELLNKKDRDKSWAGYENRIWNTENKFYTINDTSEVIEFGPIVMFENNAGVLVFYVSQWNLSSSYYGQLALFGGNIIITDSTGNYLGGFEGDYSSGNIHGATQIHTVIDKGLRFYITIDDWADVMNPNGFKIKISLELLNNKLRRRSYKKSSI
jgi:hypothetical protein